MVSSKSNKRNSKLNSMRSLNNDLLTPISNEAMLYYMVLTIISTSPFIYLIDKFAYDKSGKLVCDNYVLNSYLYTALGFCYIAIGVIFEQRIQLLPMFMVNIFTIIVFFICYLAIMFLLFRAIRNTDPENFVEINIYYFLACMLFGMVLSIILLIGYKLNILYSAILITLVLTFIMGFIGYKYGHKFITVDFDKYLTYALWGLIIWTFIAPIIIRDSNILLLSISVPSVIIFCLLLMSYNNKLRKNAEKCVVPNYPNEAIGLVIKIGNILADVITILLTRRRRRR